MGFVGGAHHRSLSSGAVFPRDARRLPASQASTQPITTATSTEVLVWVKSGFCGLAPHVHYKPPACREENVNGSCTDGRLLLSSRKDPFPSFWTPLADPLGKKTCVHKGGRAGRSWISFWPVELHPAPSKDETNVITPASHQGRQRWARPRSVARSGQQPRPLPASTRAFLGRHKLWEGGGGSYGDSGLISVGNS